MLAVGEVASRKIHRWGRLYFALRIEGAVRTSVVRARAITAKNPLPVVHTMLSYAQSGFLICSLQSALFLLAAAGENRMPGLREPKVRLTTRPAFAAKASGYHVWRDSGALLLSPRCGGLRARRRLMRVFEATSMLNVSPAIVYRRRKESLCDLARRQRVGCGE